MPLHTDWDGLAQPIYFQSTLRSEHINAPVDNEDVQIVAWITWVDGCIGDLGIAASIESYSFGASHMIL
jgi:hypothetical protein